MDHSCAPLFEELLRFIKESRGNYHVPGHKQGNAFDVTAREWFAPLLRMDLTEVSTLDDLHQPAGVIEAAQRLAADAFYADQTLFLVGGTTAGNLASILHVCRPGDEILIQRTCHQSVFHGCLLARASPLYLPVDIDKATGLEKVLDVDEIKKILKAHPSVKALMITSPSYYGVIQPIDKLAALCHEYGIPLVVDEAHGAHFGFHPDLPRSAMQQGADISIQSTHKMLTSMTMSSMLHVKGNLVSVREISRWLKMIESSSPSYPLMASLDVARRYVMTEGQQHLKTTLEEIADFRRRLYGLHHLREVVPSSQYDPLKLSVETVRPDISGYTLQEWMAEQGHYAELADDQKVLFVFSIHTTREQLDELYLCLKALDTIVLDLPRANRIQNTAMITYEGPMISFEELRDGRSIEIPVKEAIGEVVTEMIVPYPPGIPLFLPGEYVTDEKVRVLLGLMESGAKIRGIIDGDSNEPKLHVMIREVS